MNRTDTTKFLSDLLIHQRFCGIGRYWASEVTIDYGTTDVKRVDFMQFIPENTSASGIEKGIFICYEVKSCIEDYKSGFGQNFIGEKNYFVMSMETWKKVQKEDMDLSIGVLVPIPIGKEAYEEYENPTPIDDNLQGWKLCSVRPAFEKARKKGMTELLFCMLRSGK